MNRKISKHRKEKSKLSKDEWREFTKTVWNIANISDKEHPAVFPEEIPHRLIKLFSFVDEIVLDPFAGIGTTAKVALDLERKAISVDQSKKYTNIIKRRLSKHENSNNHEIIHGDSRNLNDVKDSSVNLIVTSPPYWNKADYGRGRSNLGNISSYHQFLNDIRPVFKESYRVLEPSRKIAVVTANVNQNTNHGLLTFPLAADFLIMMRSVGFLPVAEIIWNKDGTGGKWGSANGQRPIFGSYPYPPNFLFKNVNEYIIVMKKPGLKTNDNKSIPKYEELTDF